jgi:hypothetical protein
MPISIRAFLTQSFRWEVWWRWSSVSLIGVVLGALLLRELDPILLPPSMDEISNSGTLGALLCSMACCMLP